jgi:hypothetical protein
LKNEVIAFKSSNNFNLGIIENYFKEIFLSWLYIIGGDSFVKFFFSILLKDNQLNYKIK